MLLTIFITAYQNRKSVERITFKDSAGATITLAANDEVRIKIGRSGSGTPTIDLTSETPYGAGSTVSKVNPVTLELQAADINIPAGTYDIEACVVDSADDDQIKCADQGSFNLISTQQGGIT